MSNIYDLSVTKRDGSTQSLKDFEGKVLLIRLMAFYYAFRPGRADQMQHKYSMFHINFSRYTVKFSC